MVHQSATLFDSALFDRQIDRQTDERTDRQTKLHGIHGPQQSGCMVGFQSITGPVSY